MWSTTCDGNALVAADVLFCKSKGLCWMATPDFFCLHLKYADFCIEARMANKNVGSEDHPLLG